MCATAASAHSLINACRTNKLPTLKAMSDFGIQNTEGVNPLDIFECYKIAILEDLVDHDELMRALERDCLNHVIMNSPSVKNSAVYCRVVGSGNGIVNGYTRSMNECDTCARVSATPCVHART